MTNFFIGVFVFSSLIGQVDQDEGSLGGGTESISSFSPLLSVFALDFCLSDERRHRSSNSRSDILSSVDGRVCCLHEHLHNPQAGPEQGPDLVQLHLGCSGDAR